MAGYIGYDYVWIDAEHGPLDRQEIFHHIVAAQGRAVPHLSECREWIAKAMKAILDMGPDGIIFPFTNSAEVAKEAVRSCSYPDYGGVRGQGPIRAIRYGLINERSIFRLHMAVCLRSCR